MSKDTVLIIEDSPAVGMLLTDFLKKLGCTDIHTSTTGQEGLSLFKVIVDTKTTLVFLDYNLPDTDAHSVMSQLLSIKPYTKIVIETANSKEDEKIREVIGLGAYHYIQKPIRFNDLEKLVLILEEEQTYFEKHTDQDNRSVDNREQMIERIDSILKSTNQISLNKINHILDSSDSFIAEYLEKLIQDGKIIPLDDKQEIACNQCGSVRTSQIFYCPHCKSSDFK